MNEDALTGTLRAALRFLMLKSPMRTSLGATGGVFVGLLLDVARPFLRILDLSAVTDFRLSIAGIFIANISALFEKDRLPDAIEEQFRLVARAMKSGDLSKAQAKIYYAQIVATTFEKARMSSAAQQEMDELISTPGAKRLSGRSPTPSR